MAKSNTMTDEKFQQLLDNLSAVNSKYKSLLKQAEKEIERRYGYNPSDVDNDEWIDTFHVSTGTMTVKQVDDSMKLHLKNRR